MKVTKKTLLSIVAAVLIAGVMVLGVSGFGLYHFVSAAVSPTPTPGQTATPNLLSQYWQVFVNAFAQNLGITPSKLDSAFTAAVNATVDQAVKDGKITQSQANSIKSRYSQGLSSLNNGKGLPLFGFGFGARKFDGDQLITSTDIASALGISETTLGSDLKAGQSIADIAKAQNKDLNSVKQTLLNDAKTKLDSEVSNNTLTQSRADQIYQNLANSIDSMLNNTYHHMRGGWDMPWHGPGGRFNNPTNPGSSGSGSGA